MEFSTMMRRIFAALFLCLAASLPEASAGQVMYLLNFAPEAIGATGTGTGSVIFDTDISGMWISVDFSGLSGTTTVAHIHAATAVPFAGTVGVATTLPTFPGFPTGVQSGTYNAFFDMTQSSSFSPNFITVSGGTIALAFSALMNASADGKAYLNIHTSAFGGGEIRSFLRPVPEPSSVIMTAVGLTALGFVRFRKMRRSRLA
jgi:hypothetical protein